MWQSAARREFENGSSSFLGLAESIKLPLEWWLIKTLIPHWKKKFPFLKLVFYPLYELEYTEVY